MMQQTKSLAAYFDALDRLKTGRPSRVMKGTKITNDSVALEAGRGKGSIKKSRHTFLELIQAIEVAAAEQSIGSAEKQQRTQLDKAKATSHQYRLDFEAATASLIARLYEIHELKAKVRLLEEDVRLLTDRLAHASGSKVRSLSPM